MFHIDATFEDCRIIARNMESQVGFMEVEFHDTMTGKYATLIIGLVDLGKILAYAASGLDGDDLPSITYDEVAAIVKDLPVECRLIP